jgi:hypothetical protein
LTCPNADRALPVGDEPHRPRIDTFAMTQFGPLLARDAADLERETGLRLSMATGWPMRWQPYSAREKALNSAVVARSECTRGIESEYDSETRTRERVPPAHAELGVS